MANGIIFFFRRAVSDFRLNPVSSIVCVLLLVLCLVPPASLFILWRNVERALPSFPEKGKIAAYLRIGATDRDLSNLAEELRTWPEVGEVAAVPDGHIRGGLEGLPAEWKSFLEAVRGPSPPLLEISLKMREREEDAEAVGSRVKKYPQIEDVLLGKGWIGKFESALKGFGVVWLTVVGISAVAAALIVSNTIRTTAAIHRDEREILEVLWATRFFTEFPYYLESALYGLLSSLIAFALLQALGAAARNYPPAPLSGMLSPQAGEWAPIALGLTIFSVVFSLTGCRIAMGNPPPRDSS